MSTAFGSIDVSKLSKNELAAYNMILNDVQLFAETFMVNPVNNEPVTLNYVQQKMLLTDNLFNAIRVHRRAGKCVAASEYLTLADGTRVKAGELVNKTFDLLTLTETGIKPVLAAAEFNAVEDVYEIVTESGRRVVRNSAHPFYTAIKETTRGNPVITVKGWTPLEHIKVGDLVAVPEELPCNGNDVMDENELKVLAYLIGDGGYTHESVSFTQQDGAQLDELRRCVELLGARLTRRESARFGWGVCVPEGVYNGPKGGSNPIINLLRKHNLMCKHSRDKRVPNAIFKLKSNQIALFLSRLFATDGWASLHNGYGSNEIGFCSVSKGLVSDVQELLLRLGIQSRVYPRNTVDAWCLSITDSKHQLRFYECVGIYGKEPQLKAVADAAKVKVAANKGKWRYDKVPEAMRWEVVKSIDYAGTEATIAVEVPGYETFLTTFYEHNSFGLVIYAVWYALTHRAAQILIICPDRDKVNALFELIDRFLDASPGFKQCLIRASNSSPTLRKFNNNSTIQGFTTGARTKGAAEALRGQTADVVIIDEAAFLNEDDWPAIEPIIFGDAKRAGKVICFISSTPTAERGRYWEMCTKLEGWNQVHVPITENPEWTDELLKPIRAMCNDFTWTQEYLAEFPDIGEGVYRRSYIDRSQRDYSLYNLSDPSYVAPPAIRTMGVDWDKYQAGPSIMVLELDQEQQKFKVVHCEEIPRTEYCLTAAVDRIIQLNTQLNPTHIYVDRGYGDTQVELLHKYGDAHPYTGLKEKVRGLSFYENVEQVDPAIGESVKKRLKPVMVNITVKWFEDDLIIYPRDLKHFTEQLQDFKVLGVTDSSIKYSTENEHFIDAFCLAAFAMHEHYANPFTFEPASRSFILPPPEVVPVSGLDAHGKRIAYGTVKEDPVARRDFGGRKLPNGNKLVGRTLTSDKKGLRRGF